jgi:hypothetical protein
VRLYGNAFSPGGGSCFRLVYEESTTRPVHCPGTVITRGWWQDGRGAWWLVDACREHADELIPTQPAGARVAAPLRVTPRESPNRQKAVGPTAFSA